MDTNNPGVHIVRRRPDGVFYALPAVLAYGLGMLMPLRIDPRAPRSNGRPPGIAGLGSIRSLIAVTV